MTCPFLPMEYNVVVEVAVEEKTAGGIILLQKTQEADKLAADEGTLIAISPLAFNFDNWPENARKPEVGDRVVIARYAGIMREHQGRTLRLLKDKDIIAIVDEPMAVAKAA